MKPLANPHLMALSPGAINQDIPLIANSTACRPIHA